jgi:ankyrin repeat protein
LDYHESRWSEKLKTSPINLISDKKFDELREFICLNPKSLIIEYDFIEKNSINTMTLIEYCIDKNNADALRVLLDLGASPYSPSGSQDLPVYIHSFQPTKLNLLKVFLEYELTIEYIYNNYDIDHFYISSWFCDFDSLNTFIDDVADLGFSWSEYEKNQDKPILSPFIYAIRSLHSEEQVYLITRLLNLGLRINFNGLVNSCPLKVKSPLTEALRPTEISEPIIDLLLESGADIVQTNQEFTELMGGTIFYIAHNTPDISDSVLNKVVVTNFLNNYDNQGWGVIHCAIFGGNTNLLKWLFIHNINLNLATTQLNDVDNEEVGIEIPKGSTPLMISCRFMSLELISELLELGASVNELNSKHQTALDIVFIEKRKREYKKNIYDQAILILKEQGALTAKELYMNA